MLTRTPVTGAVLGAACVAMQPAFAQDAVGADPRVGPTSAAASSSSSDPAPEQRTAAADPGDIIVTARRRQESILKVPVVENVVSAAQIERQQLTTLTAISTRTPGLNIGTAVLAIGPQISLRGVGTSSADAGVDQSVSLNIDGLSLTQGLAFNAGVFDLAQVEVLKGPQALFFGKNSPAGVISLRTADPGNELEIIGRLGYEVEAREKRGELIISSPITDTLGIRIAGLASFQDGFFYNRAQNLTPAALATGAIPPDRRFGKARDFIIRGTVVWSPASDFKARLKVNHTYDYSESASQGQFKSCPDGTVTSFPFAYFNPNENCKFDRTLYIVNMNPTDFPAIRNGGTPFFKLKQTFGTLELNYTPAANVNITSITGYYHVVSDSLINATQTGFDAPPYGADNSFRRRDVTQELRLDTSLSGPLNATLGAFYQDADVYNKIELPINVAELPAAFFPNLQLATGSHDLSIRAYSAFGQLRYKVVPTVELAGGVRWSRETRSDQVFDLSGARPIDISQPNDGKFTTTNYSPEATITWTPTDTLTFFGAYKKGYKSGSFTITSPASTPSFGDEKVSGYEAGVKTRVLDRQLSVNLAAYNYKYSGLQVGIYVVTNNQVIVRTLNAAGARVKGVDFDFNFTPQAVKGLSLYGALNYNHARFTSFVAPCTGGQTIAQGCNQQLNPATGRYTGQNLAGQPLVRAPDWQLSGGIDYELPVGANKVQMGVGAQYSSKYLTNLGLRQDLYQRAYAMFDANLAYVFGDGRWEIGLIGRNLTNRITTGNCANSDFASSNIFGLQITGSTTSGPSGVDELGCVARRGREAWIRLSVKS